MNLTQNNASGNNVTDLRELVAVHTLHCDRVTSLFHVFNTGKKPVQELATQRMIPFGHRVCSHGDQHLRLVVFRQVAAGEIRCEETGRRLAGRTD